MSAMDGSAVEAVAELERRSADREIKFPEGWIIPEGIVVQRVHHDERLETLDLEALDSAPRDVRGVAQLYDGPSFVAYVQRLHTAATTVWATQPTPGREGGRARPGGMTAVFNDHADAGSPGWRDARATLHVQDDPDWLAWTSLDGQLVSQKQFAQFLLDHVHNIVAPSNPAKLMPAVLQFQAARNAAYSSHVNLDNGEVRLSYVEEIKQNNKGTQQVAMPQVINLGLYPFAGANEAAVAFPVEARLRWELPRGEDTGPLKIGYKLTRPDQVVLQAWERLTEEIRAGLPDTVLLLQGVAPDPLR